MDFYTPEPKPIKTKYDILIRIVLPIGILALIIYSFYPIINHEIACLYNTNSTGIGVCN